MKKLNSFLWASLVSLNSTVYAEVKNFTPHFPQFYSSAATRKADNQFYKLGEANFLNGVAVPFYGVTAQNPIEDGLLKNFEKCTLKSCSFNFKLDAQHAKQLKLLALPETGLVLVPRNWQDVQANAGANGTGFALVMSPDQKQAIELYDSSFCVGCGLPNATLYFPELLKESIENEFGGFKDPKKLINIVHPSKKVAFFSYQIPQVNNKTHGIAKYDDEDTFNYKEIQVTLDKSQQSLVGPILNFYNATH
ncbi:TPA: DUF4850 domain-containing protein [Acinetobacter nosocomialis]|uniref:DUF4850 domain-containing protein n=1 Tax=Acinetobacter nosocomialis TaxID=106654 RepID=A0A2L1VDA0_ACINO|nr:DUF4850 domain-containing protein [Acinetobacter nosocomialis]AJB47212.1 signal peptide protein [Acinetobacter nosocomialis]ARG15895.1 DUF4850 domain-containing protein [Acinetobacter nosocomialis]AVF43189.1 DUF4850 domain-containing protein [Acinetobacter nosocomialis]AWL18180.1 DUF4850 domain-containing protein [Acinetobacter nosocomialis]MBO8214999.1 DUF4850 domain-containing protein [Acinetobacter nosocomialis]